MPTFRSAVPNGHAIEVRVYAENPDAGFLPSPGRITHLRPPSGPGIRDDSGVFEGWTVPTAYDPLVSKVVAWAPDRSGAIARMDRALAEYDLRGINTTIAFCRDLVRSPAFADAAFDTTYVDRLLEAEWQRTRYARRAGGDRGDRGGDVCGSTGRPGVTGRPGAAPGTGTPESGLCEPGIAESLWAQRARLDALR